MSCTPATPIAKNPTPPRMHCVDLRCTRFLYISFYQTRLLFCSILCKRDGTPLSRKKNERLVLLSLTDIADVYPLDEDHRDSLRCNFPHCASNIDSSDCMFINALRSQNCLTDHQKSALMAEKVPENRNELLILILMRRSVADFKKFLNCLSESGQGHIVLLFKTREGKNSMEIF
jgi:hypothetical protein